MNIIKASSKIIAISVMAMIFSSCVKERGSAINPDDTPIFDWKNIKTIDLSIPATSSVGITSVKVYSSALFTDDSMIAAGSATASSPFVAKIDIEKRLTQVFIKTVSALGEVNYYSHDITSAQTKALTKSVSMMSMNAVSLPEIETLDIVIPNTFDVVFDKNPNNYTTLTGNKTYYIPSGANITNNINVSNYTGTSTLYVAGRLKIDYLSFQHCSLVVLDGGEVDVSSLSFSNFNNGEMALYVMEGGYIKQNSLNVSSVNGAYLVNKGDILSDGNINFSGAGTFYNEGTLKGKNKPHCAFMHASNDFVLKNEGTISSSNFNIVANSKLYNYTNANINIDNSLDAPNSSTGIYNYGGFMSINSLMNIQGTLENHGYIGAETFQTYAAKVLITSGALIESNVSHLHSSTITMQGGAMYTTFDMSDESYNYGTTFKNTDTEKALIIVYNSNKVMRDQRWSQNFFDGAIEVNYRLYDKDGNYNGTGVTQGNALEVSSCKNGAYFIKTQSTNIPETVWNKGNGNITLDTPTDTDGDGVIDSEDTEPENPDVAYYSYFPSKETYGTYAFEDLWPYLGDYDMNDVVLDFQIIKATDKNNKVTYMDFNWSLRAAGTTRSISMGVQLDKIISSAVSSVVRSSKNGASMNLSASPIGSSNNGLEAGQTNAVFALFNAVNDVYPGVERMFNTTTNKEYITPTFHSVRVNFSSKPSPEDINMDMINVFIVANEYGKTPERGNETHLCTFKATDLANTENKTGGYSHSEKNHPFIANTGAMWGIMIPEKFLYPLEGMSINHAYNFFKPWYMSTSGEHNDWYKDISGYRNENRIY